MTWDTQDHSWVQVHDYGEVDTGWQIRATREFGLA